MPKTQTEMNILRDLTIETHSVFFNTFTQLKTFPSREEVKYSYTDLVFKMRRRGEGVVPNF